MNPARQREFILSVINGSAAEEAVDWVRDNLSPDDVYGTQGIRDWVISNFDPEELYDIDKLKKAVSSLED